ncbi:hypothetical protein ILUMI_11062 [Ignelater luminosus]|uniref:Serpin domain-containing protein n=1 Tax=Ignelater luminosus TaxID=2038154 RepID=A0A8K0D2T4_IGNLU|nr:hypothetical protein ILUMI_11062 [Ignelater luminosus]
MSIYKKLLKPTLSNFIVCPLSADIALALTTTGAQGQTAQELVTALHLPKQPQGLQEAFKIISHNLHGSDQYTLNSANKIYIKNKFQINNQFKKLATDVFNVDIQNINFEKNIDAANEINRWVEDKTQNKIVNLIHSSLLNNETQLVLINAIYFHGKWVKQFDPSASTPSTFYLNNNYSTKTKMMTAEDYYEYYESSELNAKFLKLDYAGNEVSMHIVLPNNIEGLSVLEKRLLDVLVPPKYNKEKVHVMIPRMKLETQIDFKSILQAMGVKSAFENDANFHGIAANEGNLKITEVIQKAFLVVTEEGTTAAASTGLVYYVPLSAAPQEESLKMFFANRPFLFYLRLNRLGVNFFVGRHGYPSL